jgi:sarcosine oxidase subunit alpha
MSQRLPPQPGEWIDRSRPLEFRFEGSRFAGFEGDTISSALAASGVRLLGRSFKYHRPRGIYSLANHDVNVMLEGRTATNIRGDTTPLWAGADLAAVNTVGSLRRDMLRIADRFGKLMPVGFYYKAFHRPRRLFPFYERRLRQVAGLGRIDPLRQREHAGSVFDFCDVLVIGAGPAGLAAAIAAAGSGAKVVVVDEQPRPGGSLNYQWATDLAARQMRESLLAEAAKMSGLEIRTSTVAAGCYADHWVALVDRQRLTKVRARGVIMATGCFEQPAVFGNNDLPGVMLATAAQRLVHQYAVRPFQRAVLLAANAAGYRAALDLVQAGVRVTLVDLRPEGEPSPLAEQVRQAGINVFAGHAVTRALPGPGKRSIRGVRVAKLDATGRPESGGFELPADGVAMSVGFASADSLYYQAGGRMGWDAQLEQYVPDTAPHGLFAAGGLNGCQSVAETVEDGRRQGLTAVSALGMRTEPPPERGQQTGPAANHAYPVYPDPTAKCFLDLDEDVQYKDVVNAVQEGFDQVELLKRYSTFGMGPSQGKLANLITVRVLARTTGRTVPETGMTRARPFFHPVPLAQLAGRGFHPHRQTSLDGRHAAAGAVFMPAGEWRRPAYYAVESQSPQQTIFDEVRAVRQRAGMIDVGTLGKLEISGPDAGELIERVYTGRFKNMKAGTARYGLACDESGVIVDDGLVARLADDRFYLTTTTTASGAVYRELQRWVMIWGLNVVLANVTGHSGAINLAGPSARAILQSLADIDLSPANMPYLAVREGRVADVPARLLRVGFVGEWGCEIHVPAFSAPRVWDAIAEAGRHAGVRPFGVEAQRVLRLEKAHIIVSQDTDGLTHPLEANMAWALKAEKPFFIGQRSLAVLRTHPLKRLLVGFMLEQDLPAGSPSIPKECHLIVAGDEIRGRVTSITHSLTLGRVIGLAFVPPDAAEPGTCFDIRIDDGSLVAAKVVATPFYDPKNLRQTEAGA